MAGKLILNRAMCRLCNDIITSESGYDFKSCFCGEISVDGGLEYTRRVANKLENVIEMSEYSPV